LVLQIQPKVKVPKFQKHLQEDHFHTIPKKLFYRLVFLTNCNDFNKDKTID